MIPPDWWDEGNPLLSSSQPTPRNYLEPKVFLVVRKLHLEFDCFYNFVVGGGDDRDGQHEAKRVYVGDV